MKKNTILSSIILVTFLISIIAVSPVSAATVGLVGEWNFDEGNGSIAYDSSGNANDGILSGGKFGNALYFDGDEDYVNIPDDPSLDIVGDLTVEAWIKIEAFGTDEGYHMYVVGKDLAGERSYGIGVDLTWANPKKPFVIIFHPDGSNKIAWGSSDLVTDQWYHLAGVFDAVADQVTLYVNGIAQPSIVDTSTVNPGGADLRIGGRQYVGHRCTFNGVIDEVRISDVVRYSGASFVLQTAPFTSDGNTVGLWHLDESTGTTAYDASDYGNDGTIVGASWAGPTWIPRGTGYALCFDGVDDVVYIDNEENFDFDYNDAFSIEAWFNTDSGAVMNIVSKYDNDPPHAGFQLIKHGSSWGNALYFFLTNTYAYPGGNQIRCYGETDVADGFWHHVVVTYDGSGSLSGVNIYLDGVPETLGSSADTVTSDTTNDLPLQISGREGTNYVFDGMIDDVRIWNFAFPNDLVLAFSGSSDSIIQVGETANLDAELTSGGSAVEGVTVEFSSSPAGLIIDSSDVTDSGGLASVEATTLVGGVYTITATVQTPFGELTDEWTLVVFDPNGMSAGGGWYITTENDDTIGVTDGARASFGFVAKYVKGAPKGNLEFQYKAGGIDLKSTEIMWLAVGGTSAQFKGTATIKGSNEVYWFRVQAKDLGEPGVGVDDFNIKIWDGDPDDIETNLVHSSHNTLSGGNIQVKTK